MVPTAADITIETGKCWWCGAVADSREHRWKASDLVREYGKPPYTSHRTLTRFSGDHRHDFRGPKSDLVKFTPSLCARCNDTRSQRFDSAWDDFVSFVAEHEVETLRTQAIDLGAVFGTEWRARATDVERYILKHGICRLVDEAPPPITVAAGYLDFLDGGDRPEAMEIGLAIDLGVVELLRTTRAAPPPDQPEAADAGFLGTTPLWVQQSKSTGRWSEPQAGLYYRYIAIFWRLGSGSATQFDRQLVALTTTDEFFGPEFREALTSARDARRPTTPGSP